MTLADLERSRAAELPHGSVVSVLLEQHARIRDLFTQTMAGAGEQRRRAFDELRELLAVHEAGEEIVVRPVTQGAGDGKVAAARDDEEQQAASALSHLERLDVDSDEFARALAILERDVSEHAQHEEHEEFPYLLGMVDLDKQMQMGSRLLKVQRAAPAQPHPAAAGSTTGQVAVGPFAALFDKARDAYADLQKGS